MLILSSAVVLLSGCGVSERVQARLTLPGFPELPESLEELAEGLPDMEEFRKMLTPDLDFSIEKMIPEELQDLYHQFTGKKKEDPVPETEAAETKAAETKAAETPAAAKATTEAPETEVPETEAPETEGVQEGSSAAPSGPEITSAWLSRERWMSSDGVYSFFANQDFSYGGLIEFIDGAVVRHSGHMSRAGTKTLNQDGTDLLLTIYHIQEDGGKQRTVSFAEYKDNTGILEAEDGSLVVLELSDYAKEYTEHWTEALLSKMTVRKEVITEEKEKTEDQAEDGIKVDVLRMPDLRDQDVHLAMEELREYRVSVDVWEMPSETAAEGQVLDQNLPGGIRIFQGDEVILIVSSGPERK